MKIEGNFEIGGLVVKQDDRYVVKDNNLLKNLILSSTRLNPDKQTTGHKHAGQEEVYLFMEGHGEMLLDEKRFPVKKGDIVFIEMDAQVETQKTDHGVQARNGSS